MPRVVIVGGGFGGLTAARALAGAAVEVVLIDRWNHHLFQPLLYQVAMAGLSPADIAYPIRSALSSQENARVLLGEVVAVDPAGHTVTLLDGEVVPWDYLVVAVGTKSNYFGREGTWGQHSLGLKSLDEAIEMRRRVLLAFEAAEREPDAALRQRLMTFVIIGGGPTGVEVAGALAELARHVLANDFRNIHPELARVVLVERNERLLSGGFAPELSQSARAQLEELGVEVRTGTAVEAIDERGVALGGGERLEAANVLWTAGVQARSLAGRLGAELDRMGRAKVAADLSLPGRPEVFVIGDAAHAVSPGTDQPLPGLAPVAMQQGRFVAAQIVASLGGRPRGAFRYVDKGIMATIGRSRAVTQAGRLHLSGLLAWVAWLVIHIYYLIGFRNRFSVLFNWGWNYVTYKRGARLITGDRSWVRLAELAAPAPPAPAPAPSPASGVSEPARPSP